MYTKLRGRSYLSRDESTITETRAKSKKIRIKYLIFLSFCVLIGCGVIGLMISQGYKLYLRQFHGKIVGLYGRPPLNPTINNEEHSSGRGILSVVFPTHCDRFHAAELTLESLAAYSAPNTFDELILVSPERCPFQPMITKQLSNIFTSGIKSISDESLIPHIENTQIFKHHWSESTQSDSHSATWHKQMLLKLAVGFVVKTPFFLVLDDDVTMINHVSLQDFISIQLVEKKTDLTPIVPVYTASLREQPIMSMPDDLVDDKIKHFIDDDTNYVNTGQRRLKISSGTASEYELSLKANWQYDYSNWKVEWYQNTAKLLNAEHCMDDDDLTFGVTPAVLHTATVRSAMNRLRKLEGMNGVKGYWSEYAVYRVEFCLTKDFLKYHSKNPSLDFDKKLYTRYSKQLSTSSEAIYSADDALKIMKIHQENKNIFIVLQDGAVPDRIREISWDKWIQNEFDDEERSLFLSSRNHQIKGRRGLAKHKEREKNNLPTILLLILGVNGPLIIGYVVYITVCKKRHEKRSKLIID